MYSDVGLLAFIVLVAGISVVLVLYRYCTHPLANVPGPLLAKFTNARFLYHAWKGDLHLDHLRCHERYGPVYRSGPNRVVFNSLTAVSAIYSADRTIRKSDGYTSHPWTRHRIPSLFNCVDPVWASLKKRTIRPATTLTALRLHHASVEDNVETLVGLIKKGQPQDLSELGFYYALDVISQSIFGESFRTMEDPTHRWMTVSLERGNRHMYLHLAWPSLFQRLGLFLDVEPLTYPQFRRESRLFLELCENSLALGTMGSKSSIFAMMKRELPKGVTDEELHVDAYSFMRGGGDMVAVTIAATMFYVMQDSRILRRLQREIRTTFVDEPPTLGPELDGCVYLRACIEEALRMAPPGPGVFWRQASSCLTIDGIRLPAGIEFGVSIYAFHYNSSIFDDPEVYKPERMMDSAQRGALIPFLRGFRACPAQNLAFASILLPVARFIWQFELVGAPGNGSPGEKKLFPQVDVFGSSIQGPIVSFQPRIG
ncbi:cytochrome P450 like protein [Zymoseptoria brevis]|uniref:Cytochrome P450 like protein n=1 Tax=Zymoseptoria brevis TaxID=1047168 RepID=A0A0F4GBV3_9PEZI|nr:cytochrome P450 like protein [Zymoseptoria brevis]